MSDELPAVRVHIQSSDVPIGQQQRKGRRAVYQVVTLTASDEVQPLLPVGTRRKAFIAAVDAPVVINGSAPLAAAGNGAVIPMGILWPVEDDGPVYAAAATALAGAATARVSVTAIYEE